MLVSPDIFVQSRNLISFNSNLIYLMSFIERDIQKHNIRSKTMFPDLLEAFFFLFFFFFNHAALLVTILFSNFYSWISL